MTDVTHTLVVPVYNNAETIDQLVETIGHIGLNVAGELETIFVIDGSPDDSRRRLCPALETAALRSRVVDHSRNFGSFAAIRTGMRLARGRYIAVMAADLQEPPELITAFFERLETGEVDVVAGQRTSREDGGHGAHLYWRLYRRFVLPDIPPGGVDVFACSEQVRDVICRLEDVHTSLVAQLFWVGFRRELVPYERRARERGKSGWTTRRKLRYLSDSVFAFTDLPVRILWLGGLLGLTIGVFLGLIVLIGRIVGAIRVPGYAATVLLLLFFLSFNSLALGILGSYVWRAYEMVKGRPGAIVASVESIAENRTDA